jgi:hypothetical protein
MTLASSSVARGAFLVLVAVVLLAGELLILYDDELVFDGSDPSTYIVLESGACLAETLGTLGWTSPDAGADADDADGCSGPGG